MELRGKKLFNKIGNRKYLFWAYKNAKHKHQKIILLFAIMKRYEFANYDQLSFFFNRYLRAAKRLEPFPMSKIKATIEHLITDDNINFKIGVETIEKYIMDIEVPKDEVILTLDNGERITNVKRLQELEKLNKIYYENGKWYEY